MAEEDTDRKKAEIWCKRLHVFEDRCIRRSINLSDHVAEARERLKEAKSDGKLKLNVTGLREALHALIRRRDGVEDDGDWAEGIRHELRLLLDSGKDLDNILAVIETPDFCVMLGPELYAMDGEELEVADRNRLHYGRSTLTSPI
jgi:hypothetical protein